jgi:hypothetical protein
MSTSIWTLTQYMKIRSNARSLQSARSVTPLSFLLRYHFHYARLSTLTFPTCPRLCSRAVHQLRATGLASARGRWLWNDMKRCLEKQ